MMLNPQIAATLQDHLRLSAAPIGMAFVGEAPEGVPTAGDRIPSSCSMWRLAEEGVFYAPPESHFNCPVGAAVLGFELPPALQEELMGLVGLMSEARYFDPAEAGRLPSVKRPKRGILYGPLGELPSPPDLVLLWVTATQAMLAAEAVGTSLWTGEPGTKVFGRPGCAAIPIALDEARPTMSLGCAGMRTYTEIADGDMLMVLPFAQAEKLSVELPRVTGANRAITDFHEQRKAAIAGVRG
jgi:uncharacterized protein (DUF169 family)